MAANIQTPGRPSSCPKCFGKNQLAWSVVLANHFAVRVVRAFCLLGLAARNWAISALRNAGPRACWAGLGICFLFVALRWSRYDAPLIRDEGEYAYAAQLLHHGLAPYQHAFLQKPPMIIYTYALAQFLAPHLFWFPHLLAYLSAAGATALLGLIARRQFGPGVAWPAMW